MNDNIINCFIFKNENTLNDIYKYIKNRYNYNIKINDIKIELNKLIKYNIILYNDNDYYKLTKEGNVILEDNKYYYSKIITKFFKKYCKNYKKYHLKEIREEQHLLRNYLINNKEHICIICEKKLPLCLLETAHIKPRYILNYNEKHDYNNVEFMCRYCHCLYDKGLLGINNGILHVSLYLNIYDLKFINNKIIKSYNSQNNIYFTFHYI
jgi:hypothetical protein